MARKERGSERVDALVQKAMQGERQRVEGEQQRKRAAAAHEAKSDKSLRPGSPEWRRKVGR
jgi:hypothetical protein